MKPTSKRTPKDTLALRWLAGRILANYIDLDFQNYALRAAVSYLGDLRPPRAADDARLALLRRIFATWPRRPTPTALKYAFVSNHSTRQLAETLATIRQDLERARIRNEHIRALCR